jgi:YidC/Oxa1 family membrane protein insertase
MKNLNITTVVGWILIVILFGAAVYLQNKDSVQKQKEAEIQKKEQLQKAKAEKEKQQIAEAVIMNDSTGKEVVDTTLLTTEYGAFGKAATGTSKDIVVETDLQKITFSTKGGKVKSVELKQYKTWNGKPLVLFNDSNTQFTFSFFTQGNRPVNTSDFYFESEAPASIKVSGDETKAISFRLKAADDKYFEQKYTIKGNNYLMDYEVNTVGLSSIIPPNNNRIEIDWKAKLPKQEHTLKTERGNSALYYKDKDSDVGHLDETKEKQELAFTNQIEWISFKQQFFNSTLFYKDGFNPGKITANYTDKDTGYVKTYQALTSLPYNNASNQSYKFSYYFGPNHYNTLKKSGPEFEEILKLGYDFFLTSWIKYINKWFIIPVFNFFESMHLKYGIIILLMTLILKIVLHPFTAKSFRSAAMMKILTPELTALKEKYGDDQARMGQEQMKLYQRAGVSPLGGCLPMLFQMPILMAMYFFFPNSIELRQEHFLWVKDLSSYDSIISFAQPLPLIGIEHISLMTILLTITSILQAVMNSNMNAMNNQQPGMKYLPYIMPIMLMFIFNSFAAALTYYYLLQNVLGIAQQWIMQKFFIDEEKLRKQIEENKKNPKQKSGWMKKLEDAQKQAEARARESQKPTSKKK